MPSDHSQFEKAAIEYCRASASVNAIRCTLVGCENYSAPDWQCGDGGSPACFFEDRIPFEDRCDVCKLYASNVAKKKTARKVRDNAKRKMMRLAKKAEG